MSSLERIYIHDGTDGEILPPPVFEIQDSSAHIDAVENAIEPTPDSQPAERTASLKAFVRQLTPSKVLGGIAAASVLFGSLNTVKNVVEVGTLDNRKITAEDNALDSRFVDPFYDTDMQKSARAEKEVSEARKEAQDNMDELFPDALPLLLGMAFFYARGEYRDRKGLESYQPNYSGATEVDQQLEFISQDLDELYRNQQVPQALLVEAPQESTAPAVTTYSYK